MANVVQLPLLIFTRGDLVPFMTVFPRYNVDCIAPLPLAYTNDGPGHYDALIPAEESPSNDDAKTNEKPGDKTASVSPNKKTELKHKKTNFCLCGINKKREYMKKGETPRKYKSRCGCLIHFSKCSLDCKCKGLCGGTDCKEKATIQDTSPKCSRQTRKRGKNPIQTASEKKIKMSLEEHERPNTLEYFIIVSIINYFSGLCLLYDAKKVTNIYNDIIAMVVAEKSLEVLPVQTRSLQRIERTVRRIQKEINH